MLVIVDVAERCCQYGCVRDCAIVLFMVTDPENLFDAAYQALMCTDIPRKRLLTKQLYENWLAGVLQQDDASSVEKIVVPGRPPRPELVAPRQLASRKLHTVEGRAALIHAVTHIEFNAINLALDAVYRFRDLPADFYTDWLQVAVEESLHFGLLSERLETLGYHYGDFPAHNGLWEMAVKTDHDLLLRMALVPRVFEARGLDVTPGMMKKFAAVGDHETVRILEIILRDEIGHVRIGDRWYRWACKQKALNPEATFRELVESFLPGQVRGPFHEEARLQAGFSRQELKNLQSMS